MTELDQISVMLGGLKADMKASQRQRAELFTQMGALNKTMASMTSVVDTVNAQQLENAQDIKKLNALKHKVLGIVTVVPGVVGGAVAYAYKYLHGGQ